MHDHEYLEFLLPPAFSLPEWLDAAALPGLPLVAREERVSLVLYDTFDRRLLRSGWLFGIEAGPLGRRVICEDDQGRREVLETSLPPPVFAADLPTLAGRDRLARLLDVRALLPQAELAGDCIEWRLAGAAETDEPILRLGRYAVMGEDGPKPLPPRLRCVLAKGFRKPVRILAECLRSQTGLVSTDVNLYAQTLQAGGAAASAPPPLPATIDPAERADAAVRQVCRRLLATLQANEPGMLAETDTEFLHDYRVAVRRTRTVLGQMGGVFPARVTERFRRGFRELAQATSAARDGDVFLLALDDLDAQLPAPMQGQLAPLRDAVARRTRQAHVRLKARLDSAAHRRSMTAWASFLDRPPPRRPGQEAARQPIAALAGRRVWKLYRKLIREGRAITPESPPAALHELRKSAKRLRYQMESFGSLFPPEQISPLMRRLKALQNRLGEYQDLGVQAGHLRELADELRTGQAPTPTLLAIGALLGLFHKREIQLRNRFADDFGRFARRQRRKFRQLFCPPAAAPDGSPES